MDVNDDNERWQKDGTVRPIAASVRHPSNVYGPEWNMPCIMRLRKTCGYGGSLAGRSELVVPSFKLPSAEVVLLEVRLLKLCLTAAYVDEKRAQVCVHDPRRPTQHMKSWA